MARVSQIKLGIAKAIKMASSCSCARTPSPKPVVTASNDESKVRVSLKH